MLLSQPAPPSLPLMGVGRMGDLNELVERLQSRKGEAITRTERLMDEAAAAITSLIAERDGLAKQVERMEYSDGDAEHWRHLATKAQESHTAARANFLTMQGAAATLLKRAKALEAIIQDHGSAKQIRLARTALSLDTNKGDVTARASIGGGNG